MHRNRRQDGEAHVCVVGAGISGLRSAELLISAGFKVTIFEARDRIGGRVRSSMNEVLIRFSDYLTIDPSN
jgi:monoamine oxidase